MKGTWGVLALKSHTMSNWSVKSWVKASKQCVTIFVIIFAKFCPLSNVPCPLYDCSLINHIKWAHVLLQLHLYQSIKSNFSTSWVIHNIYENILFFCFFSHYIVTLSNIYWLGEQSVKLCKHPRVMIILIFSLSHVKVKILVFLIYSLFSHVFKYILSYWGSGWVKVWRFV